MSAGAASAPWVSEGASMGVLQLHSQVFISGAKHPHPLTETVALWYERSALPSPQQGGNRAGLGGCGGRNRRILVWSTKPQCSQAMRQSVQSVLLNSRSP